MINNSSLDNTILKLFLSQIEEGDINQIKKFIINYNINIKTLINPENNQNVYFYASLIKSDKIALSIFNYFYNQSVDPNHKDNLKQTCLYYTCREGKILTSSFLINECHLSLKDYDIYGQNPLYYACREGHYDICKLLIDKGIDINSEDKYGQTCLFYAIRQGHLNIVNLLVQNGININKKDHKFQTPVSYADRIGQTEISNFLVKNGGFKIKNNINDLLDNYNKRNKIIKSKKEINNNYNNNNNENNLIPVKNYLVKINKNGEKFKMNKIEIENFFEENPKIKNLLENRSEIEKLVLNCDKSLKFNENWEKIAKKILGILWKMKNCYIFHKPVDPIELGIPNYFNVIKHPMDFSTIKKKLNKTCYTNFKEFSDDMNLVFNNCYLFNGTESFYGKICSNIKNEYNKLYEQYELYKYI